MNDKVNSVSNQLSYMPGFGNDFETESLPGALPQGQNSHKSAPMAFMRSNFQVRRSPRHAAQTSALGYTAFAPACVIRRGLSL